MKKEQDFDLYKHNTMRLHSVAKCYYEPESVIELQRLVKVLKDSHKDYLLLGGGSNVLLPPKINRTVIGTGKLDKGIVIEDNKVICGTSVRIQNLIRTCQKSSLGGLEFLFSVPCLLGGAVYMNAGAGHKCSISDFIVSVKYYDPVTNEICVIKKEDADFSYRHSLFQSKPWIIVSAELCLESLSSEEIEQRVLSRLAFSHEKLDASRPSCGSVFNDYNSRIIGPNELQAKYNAIGRIREELFKRGDELNSD